MSAFPLHPLLLAAFPVLFLWSQNVTELLSVREPAVILAVVLLGTLILWGLLAAALRSVRRGGLVAGPVALLVLTSGRFVPDAAPAWITPVALLLVTGVLVALAARLGEDTVDTIGSVANVFGGVLVALSLVSIVTSAGLAPSGATTVGSSPDATEAPADARDIYYIVMDRYGREDSLREVFGYDNSGFTGDLEDAGFQVLDRALANYNKTAHSLAASLNMIYLDGLAATVPPEAGDDWRHVYRMLDDHEVGDRLTAQGYEYIHIGMWWEPTARASDADVVLNRSEVSEFRQVLETTTALPALRRSLGVADADTGPRVRNHAHTRYQFDQLDRLAVQTRTGERPRFVFAHIALPHEPYTFAADGSWLSREEERSRSRAENYRGQVEYANTRLTALFERLLDRPEEEQPIILLVADEGPHPVAYEQNQPTYNWREAPVAALREKLRILSALHLPGHPPVPDDLTPVNLFRVVLSSYLGADLPLLPDRVYVFEDESNLYDFTDVTERVRG